ncbi:hypothetical protein [uncultured Helicobacter sp.]|nr:hypothetical protein [uncultured Helicobacter sp.]
MINFLKSTQSRETLSIFVYFGHKTIFSLIDCITKYKMTLINLTESKAI